MEEWHKDVGDGCSIETQYNVDFGNIDDLEEKNYLKNRELFKFGIIIQPEIKKKMDFWGKCT